MHGLIVNQLRQFVVTRLGKPAWESIAVRVGPPLESGPLSLDHVYDDAVVSAIVTAAVETSGIAAPDLLEDFGSFLAPVLLRIYGSLVPSGWRTLDVIEHTEEHIHTVVRMRDENAGPPDLAAERLSPTEVLINYTSPRRLCKVAEGIARGMASHFGEQVDIRQSECMLRGDPRCLISVRLTA